MFTVNVPALLVHRTKLWNDYEYCGVKDGCTGPLFLTFFIFAYVLPLFVICLLYLLVLRHLRQAKSASLVDNSDRTARAFKVIVLVVVIFGLSMAAVTREQSVGNVRDAALGTLLHGV